MYPLELQDAREEVGRSTKLIFWYKLQTRLPRDALNALAQLSVCVLVSARPLQLEVHEAKAMVDNHPQWDIPDTEEEDEEQEDSDGIEESEDDDEDND